MIFEIDVKYSYKNREINTKCECCESDNTTERIFECPIETDPRRDESDKF